MPFNNNKEKMKTASTIFYKGERRDEKRITKKKKITIYLMQRFPN